MTLAISVSVWPTLTNVVAVAVIDTVGVTSGNTIMCNDCDAVSGRAQRALLVRRAVTTSPLAGI